MKTNHTAWENLVAAARRAPLAADEGSADAPYGFATRVAALGLTGGGAEASAAVFARTCVRVCGIACMLAAGAVAVNFQALARLGSVRAPVAVSVPAVQPVPSVVVPAASASGLGDGLDGGSDDPVAEVVDLAS